MRIVVVGASGTIGRPLCAELSKRHELITAARSGGDVSVDITSAKSIEQMYQKIGRVDACVCVAASGALDRFADLTESELLENMRGKFFGQINLVLIGQRYLADNGSFTLTTGIFADEAWPGVTGGAVISGGLHSFVLSAAIELPRGLRINAVSPTMVADSVEDFGHLFPGMEPVAMERLIRAYANCVEGGETGGIIRAYR
ncbi:short chain dehydrogenase [Mesorhizobium loti]|uniref:Short chain dehydrogenase n=1 Tax=Rhizobium loti TaxID=381 RepID=A0A6M7U1E6_RHILI|nr:short chain dehydrogenase [Mesorhizobium loti]OBQ62222.1 short chain dehydrogenase [Mesorhizobium loti]QKC71289.1 short chain dehydrogenase [Mesorhizobium loti]